MILVKNKNINSRENIISQEMRDNLIVSYSCLKIFVDDETYKSIFDDENKEESIRLKSTIYMDNST